jgi:hypothetical protein
MLLIGRRPQHWQRFSEILTLTTQQKFVWWKERALEDKVWLKHYLNY